MMVRAILRVKGIVQGVGFRPFVFRLANELELKGEVRNLKDGTVEIEIEGDDGKIDNFLKALESQSPPLSEIYEIKISYAETKGYKSFKIVKSRYEAKLSGSTIPPDVSICEKCEKELFDKSSRRHNYFFITCTDCGPRFTIIEKLPYDRENTTMKEFEMCEECQKEYKDPMDRRFHAQTIACPRCGPRVYLTDSQGCTIECDDPVREVAKLIDEGFVVGVKGNGGYHIACATTLSEPIERIRKAKHRKYKPFAIMARDIQTIKGFADVSPEETDLLTSWRRPIVLLRKSENYYLSELIAPGLDTIGVMLPYTGLHLLMFQYSREPAFVMTSANPSGEPICIDENDAIKRMGREVDYFLVHNRKIAHRCDDSVVKWVRGQAIIRRSRGFAPSPIRMKIETDEVILALGGEENVAGCVVVGEKAFLTQHIGDVENIETLNFLRESITHLMELLNVKPDAVGCDLHPQFATTYLADKISNEMSIPCFRIQHHHAHGASLIAEHGLEDIIAIVCDGFGYGEDGSAWGGEILYCTLDEYERIGYLEPHIMPGGDLTTKYPLRMVASILGDLAEEILYNKVHEFPYGEAEIRVVMKDVKEGKGVRTTSCGRVLDAASALLGICYERTYNGEPAIRLEAIAKGGKNVLQMSPEIKDNILMTTPFFEELLYSLEKFSVRDLAYSVHNYIAEGLFELAMKGYDKTGVECVGFGGGVAYNTIITERLKSLFERESISFVLNEKVPRGDGGVSLGQCASVIGMLQRT